MVNNGAICAFAHIQQQHCAGAQVMHQQHVVMDRQLNAPAVDFVGVLQHHRVSAEQGVRVSLGRVLVTVQH